MCDMRLMVWPTLLFGSLVTTAANAAIDRQDRGSDPASSWHQDDEDPGDADERRSNRDARRRRAAVDACRETAADEAAELGFGGRVGQIDGVSQNGRTFFVKGVFVAESERRNRLRLRFACTARAGQVMRFAFRDRWQLDLIQQREPATPE